MRIISILASKRRTACRPATSRLKYRVGPGILLSLMAIIFLTGATLPEWVWLHFVLPSGEQTTKIAAETAVTPRAQSLGLMYRRKLNANAGMLFVYFEMKVRSFWMKNTYIPLDMIFIDDEGRVVGILENVPPSNNIPRSVGVPSQYVLEVNAGTARLLGIVPGALLVTAPPVEGSRDP